MPGSKFEAQSSMASCMEWHLPEASLIPRSLFCVLGGESGLGMKLRRSILAKAVAVQKYSKKYISQRQFNARTTNCHLRGKGERSGVQRRTKVEL